jgi:glycosyltransferase involved in cell wall biosynthesis
MFDRVVTFTGRDADAARALAPGARLATIPIGVRVPATPLSATGTSGPTILFVGSFVHFPNEDAAVRLATQILPLVQRRVPGATLVIVGSAPSRRVLALASSDVRVHGSVPDVGPYLDAAAVIAAPIRFGSGMRVKVLEALAAGKALVCSPLAAAGVTARDGSELRLAEDDEAFADAIVDLLSSDERRVALGRNARQWASEHASARTAAAAFGTLYGTILRERTATRPIRGTSGIEVPVA